MTAEQVLEHLLDLTTIKLTGARIMADSDNTTTLPFVTRRRKRRIVVFNLSVPGGGAEARDASEVSDPAVAAARLWRDAQARSLTLCRRQQRLETTLMRTVGSPLAAAAAHEAEARAARWRQMDREIGYSRTKDAEDQAARAAEQLLDKLARTPAASMAGVIAKLDVVLREARTHDQSSSFPWAQLRSVLADLKRLSAEAEHGPPSWASRYAAPSPLDQRATFVAAEDAKKRLRLTLKP